MSNYLTLVLKYKPLYFLDVVLKSYGQVAVCLNPATGFLIAVSIFYLSEAVGLWTLLGCIASLISAFLIRARPLHINSGMYGFNGVILGVAWPWFFKMTAVSGIFLIITAVASAVVMKLLSDISIRTKVNLPVFSLPSIILIWLIYVLLHGRLNGPDNRIIEYLQSFGADFTALNSGFNLSLFWKAFYRHIIVFLIIFTGILLHSRIAAFFSLISLPLIIFMVFCLGGGTEFINIEFYLYNAVPCAIALGGTFLVFNRKIFLFTVLGIITAIFAVFFGMRNSVVPVFVAPFNFISILFIYLLKADILKRQQGFYAIPMDFVSTPEFGLEWFRGERFADNYWRQIEKIMR